MVITLPLARWAPQGILETFVCSTSIAASKPGSPVSEAQLCQPFKLWLPCGSCRPPSLSDFSPVLVWIRTQEAPKSQATGNRESPRQGFSLLKLQCPFFWSSCHSSGTCSFVNERDASYRVLSYPQRKHVPLGNMLSGAWRGTENTGKFEVHFAFEVETLRVRCLVKVSLFGLEKSPTLPRLNKIIIYPACSQPDGGVRRLKTLPLSSIFPAILNLSAHSSLLSFQKPTSL